MAAAPALVPTGVGVWLCTVAIGMVLRVVSGQGTALAFILVALRSSGCSSSAGGWRSPYGSGRGARIPS